MTKINLPPIHPGEILNQEFLLPLNMSSGLLAKKLGLPRTRIERLVNEQTSVSVDTALRLAKYFDTTPGFWMNLQTSFDIATVSAVTDLSHIQNMNMTTA